MNPVALELGFITIYWYSICLFLAFFIGGVLALKEARLWGISEDFMINLFFYLIIFGMLGARLYYVAFNWEMYSSNLINILKIWEGGLAIHGGIIAGIIVIILYSRKYNIGTLKLLDILVPSLILGQAIGRWGNFFNGEAHGPAVSLNSLEAWHLPDFIIEGMHIDGLYYMPTFLIESALCLLGFILLYVIRSRKYTKIGQTFSIYLVWYGIIRFVIEHFRTDSLMFGGIKTAQAVSVLMIIVGIIMFIIFARKRVFEGNYNDVGNARGNK